MFTPPSSAKDLSTACVLCSQACALRVDVEDGHITKVRPDPTSPISEGYICNKAASIDRYVHHAQRLHSPLRRRPDGGFDEISWDTALTEITEKLSALRAEHGGQALSLVGLAGQANHMEIHAALTFALSFGADRWFNTLAQEKMQHFLVDQALFDAPDATAMVADEARAELLIVMGSNPRISNRGGHPGHVREALRRDSPTRVVVVDPRSTESAARAERHLRVRPGGDAFLLLGLAVAILERGWADEAWLAARVSGLDELRAALAEVRVEDMAARAGVSAEELLWLAEAYACTPRACILADLGVEQAPFSTLVSWLLRVLALLTGKLGRPGAYLFAMPIAALPEEPRRGAAPRARVSGLEAFVGLSMMPCFSPALFPEEVLTDHPERLRAVLVDNANPLLSCPDTAAWRRAFEALELLVVIDVAMSETAAAADYVLPACSSYERWETGLFPRGPGPVRLQVRPPVLPRAPNTRTETEIYEALLERLALQPPPPWLARALQPWSRRAPVRQAITMICVLMARSAGAQRQQEVRAAAWLSVTLREALASPTLPLIWILCLFQAILRRPQVSAALGGRWAWRGPMGQAEELLRRTFAHPEGVELARFSIEDSLSQGLRTPDGRARIAPSWLLDELARALASGPMTSAAYPFVLSTGLRTRWTANTLHRDPRWRKGKGPHCPLSLSVEDAEAIGVTENDQVCVETRAGRAVLPVRVDPGLQRGHVSAPNGFGQRGTQGLEGVNLNELTSADHRDPISGVPYHKHVPCQVRKFVEVRE